MAKAIQTEKAPSAIGAYSQVVKKGNMLFISGQLPIDPKTKEMSDNIAEQAEKSLKNIQAILEAADMTLENVVKNTIFVTSLEQAAEVNEVYATFLKESKPAREMVGVKELPKNALIEIDSIAIL